MRALALLCLLSCSACATYSKAKVIETSIENPARRKQVFEATLEVLDRNPTYVDEFFALAQDHHRTLERFTVNDARAAESNRWLIQMTAEQLRAHPKALQNIMEATLDAVEHDEAGRRAVANAIKARASIAAGIVVEEHDALAKLGRAMAHQAAHDPATRDNLREAVKEATSDRAQK